MNRVIDKLLVKYYKTGFNLLKLRDWSAITILHHSNCQKLSCKYIFEKSITQVLNYSLDKENFKLLQGNIFFGHYFASLPLFQAKHLHKMAEPPKYTGTTERGLTKDLSIPVPWGVIAGKEYGNVDSQATPVLCLHGWLDNCNTFDNLIPLLPKDKYFVFIDLPGHGKSSKIPLGASYSIFGYVALVERICKHFSWSTVSFLSHSLGANISGVYSGTFPEKVDKLVLLDSVGVYVGLPDEKAVDMLRESIEGYARYEAEISKLSSSYTYSDAKSRLLKSNKSLTSDAADILMLRSVEQNANGMYVYTRDKRHLCKNPSSLNINSAISFMSKIQAETMHIFANDGLIKMLVQKEYYSNCFNRLVTEGFQACKFYKRVDVDGKHHVHLTDPENVIDHIVEMLDRPLRRSLNTSL